MSNSPKPIVLIILDGWGHSDTDEHNAIAAADTPVWDELWSNTPHSLISASGLDVGLPDAQMGNSEVGHMVMGSGRILYQNFTRITKDIEDGAFFSNPVLCRAIDRANSQGKKVHILGLLSPGGVHSHENHIHAMVDLAIQKGASSVQVHAFLDGRDTPPRSAMKSLRELEEKLAASGKGRIATIVGRYFAMDRDNRWDRIEKAYDALTTGQAPYYAPSATDALQMAYDRGEDDEFVQATIIGAAETIGKPGAAGETAGNSSASRQAPAIEEGDAVICMNFRADRAREITRAFVEPSFDGFNRKAWPKLSDYVMLTEYSADIDASCAYPAQELNNVLGEYLASLGKTQLRIAETEKYAHVTFFFSGGREEPFKAEDRILIPSPKVATYDLQPEMSAPEVTEKLVEAIAGKRYDLIVCNYANGDMVGHTGIFDAAVKAVETLDQCLGKVIRAVREAGGEALITADHGNVERMLDEQSGQPHTAHTSELVPLVYVSRRDAEIVSRAGGLADIAPTILYLMGLEQPEEMTGESLIKLL